MYCKHSIFPRLKHISEVNISENRLFLPHCSDVQFLSPPSKQVSPDGLLLPPPRWVTFCGHCSLRFAPSGPVASPQCGPVSAAGESSWFFHVFSKMKKLLISIPKRKNSHSCPQLHPISPWTQWKSLLFFLHLHFLHHCIVCVAGLFSSLVIHVVFFWLCAFMQFRESYFFMAFFELHCLLSHCSLLSPDGYVRSSVNESSSRPISDYIEFLCGHLTAQYSPLIFFFYSWPEKTFTSDTRPPISSLQQCNNFPAIFLISLLSILV